METQTVSSDSDTQRRAAPECSARRPVAARSSTPIRALARRLARAGVRPNAISAASVVFALSSAALLLCAPRCPAPTSAALCYLAAAALSLAVALMGVAGGLTMSAIKRDRGIKDFGELLPGHGGMLDRVDSLCFAAPVLFHLTRFFYA